MADTFLKCLPLLFLVRAKKKPTGVSWLWGYYTVSSHYSTLCIRKITQTFLYGEVHFCWDKNAHNMYYNVELI